MRQSFEKGGRRKAALARKLDDAIWQPVTCCLPGCSRPSMRSEGRGLAQHHCRYHVQHKARHGSHWHGTYKASELLPYARSADAWLRERRQDPLYQAAYWDLEHMMAGAGRVEPEMDLKGQSAVYRARMAFARVRAAEIPTRRLIVIYLAVAALIEDDWKSHNVREFRIVQAAKVVHRLASGTHRKWDTPGMRPVELHVYPRSSGYVLRKMGEVLEKACGELAGAAVPEIIALRTDRFGPHPSHPPVARAS